MRVLLIHTEFFRWEPKEPAGEIRDEPNRGEAKNALVAFLTVEETTCQTTNIYLDSRGYHRCCK